jgi:hypothetical protein
MDIVDGGGISNKTCEKRKKIVSLNRKLFKIVNQLIKFFRIQQEQVEVEDF